jgi:hypothetical protein
VHPLSPDFPQHKITLSGEFRLSPEDEALVDQTWETEGGDDKSDDPRYFVQSIVGNIIRLQRGQRRHELALTGDDEKVRIDNACLPVTADGYFVIPESSGFITPMNDRDVKTSDPLYANLRRSCQSLGFDIEDPWFVRSWYSPFAAVRENKRLCLLYIVNLRVTSQYMQRCQTAPLRLQYVPVGSTPRNMTNNWVHLPYVLSAANNWLK